MKILIIHADKFPWATFYRAEALKKQWSNDWVDIVDRWHLPDGKEYDVIHILFSGGISKIKTFILANRNKTFTSLSSQRTLDGRFDRLDDLIEIYQKTVCCVCHNPELSEKLKELIIQYNMVYIPNGVDEMLFRRKFIVGFVGINDGHDHKGLKLIKQACEELKLELRVIKKGKTQDEVRDFYKEIDCLALASLSEGCNNPTLEVLAMNKPVISTRVGIAEELEGVILVERNVESIKKELRKLSGRIQILEKYTWKIIAQKYRNLYVEKLGIN